ncbi:MAG: PadR family transcriptional regulator [Planctomycetota bacterium]|jgi:DNA-binding PadR family transcriptional regulator
MTERSDLEHVVLGIVWKMGPMTPYAIRREFLTSPTPHFSGSAGAIYPLVRRLESDRLLDSEAVARGRRRGRQYRITDRGLAMLRRWLRPPIPDADAGSTFDPLRVRVYFLAALPRTQRERYLDEAIAALRARRPQIVADERRYADSGDAYSRLASRGIRLSLEARLRWLADVRRELTGGAAARR